MKRVKGIFQELLTWENLECALGKTLKGKRKRADARRFLQAMPQSLQEVSRRLLGGEGPQGEFHEFTVYDPKQRKISAPAFSDRVFHHALMNGCETPMERTLVEHCYACRLGKGSHAAVRYAQRQAARSPWYLKMDVRHYFETIPRQPLAQKVERLFAEGEIIQLWRAVIWSHQPQDTHGLPIGALTSQHLANFYLGFLDRWILQTFRPRGYVRYMDDEVVWDPDRAKLREMAQACQDYAMQELGLRLKPPILNRTSGGMDFLGFRIRPSWIGLARRGRRRLRDRFQEMNLLAQDNEQEAMERITAALAFVKAAKCRQFLRKLAAGIGQ